VRRGSARARRRRRRLSRCARHLDCHGCGVYLREYASAQCSAHRRACERGEHGDEERGSGEATRRREECHSAASTREASSTPSTTTNSLTSKSMMHACARADDEECVKLNVEYAIAMRRVGGRGSRRASVEAEIQRCARACSMHARAGSGGKQERRGARADGRRRALAVWRGVALHGGVGAAA
jgi:hypothetical protein